MILRDDIFNHRKFLLAGQLIGEAHGGALRALGVYVAAIGYARQHLTNGFIDDVFLDTFLTKSEQKLVMKAMTNRRVLLFHRVRDGYRIHDFAHYNSDAAKVRRQRELTRERVRKYRETHPVENSDGSDTTGDGNALLKRSVTRYSEKEKEKEVRTTKDLEHRPVGRTARSETPTTTTERTTEPSDDGNFRVIEKLAHTLMDGSGIDDPTDPELTAALKTLCAQLHIDYGRTVDPDVVGRALTSAAMARAKLRRIES